MLKKAALIILAVGVVAAVIFWAVKLRKPTLNEARVSYCNDLNDYRQAVLNLRSISEDSTVDDLNEVQKAIQASWEKLQESSVVFNAAQESDLWVSYKILEETIQRIPGNTALSGARADLYLAALNALSDAQLVNKTSCPINVAVPTNSE